MNGEYGMVLLSASQVSKSFGTQDVIKKASFSIGEGDKIGLLGVNGAGKTTLFRMIAGELSPDSGTISISRQTSIAYMQQHAEFTADKTALDEVGEVFSQLMEDEARLAELERQLATDHSPATIEKFNALQERFLENGGMTFRARIRSTLLGLGFLEEELTLPLSAISGGQRTRALLAKLLLGEHQLLLLDEPTNHLDIKAVTWLEGFLQDYKGTLVIISHDRYFLDKVCNRIFDLENGLLETYPGNYTSYVAQKELRRLTREREYERKTAEIRRLEGIIAQQKQWNRERNLVTARSKQKAIDRIEATLEAPQKKPEEIRFRFHAAVTSGNDVLTARDIAKAFDGRQLFRHVNLEIKRQEKVFLLGDNGCGKTTLFRILLGKIRQDAGTVELGAKVKIGYYDQAQSDLADGKTILETISDALPHLDHGAIRNALAAFLFRGDDVNKLVGTLSGGEKARVALCRLMLSSCNLLLLDEPTNHLDIPSKEVLEEALAGYDGTLLMISHDRYFIDKLAERIYRLTEQGAQEFGGNYTYFLEHAAQEEPTGKGKAAPVVNEYKRKKERASQLRQMKGKVRRAEERIAALEADMEAKQAELEGCGADYEKALEVTGQLAALQEELDQCYQEWEDMLTQLEEEEEEE